tara:strand:- start:13683 stop:14453 length:771 start_codon:yes stop_codon:yes gene_type:complete
MELFYKQYSSAGKPLIILHGLFGHQGNWATHAKALSDTFAVVGFDARNHGQSPHSETMSYELMAEDVMETMDALGIKSANFIGHSMGGKTAMQLALKHPERVEKLLVVDIAPVAYQAGPDEVLAGLQHLDPGNLFSRKQADESLQDYIGSKNIRDFLLSNLQRSLEGAYQWRMGLAAISSSYAQLKAGLEAEKSFSGKTLFIKGEYSDYILSDYKSQILNMFPAAKIVEIAGAGHWVHSEKPEQFLKLARDFLEGQ